MHLRRYKQKLLPSRDFLKPQETKISSSGTMIRGELEVEIQKARNLPDTDQFLFNMFSKDVTDAYVSGYLGSARILMTSVKDNTLNPEWFEKFSVPVCHRSDSLKLEVQDKDHAWSESIGEVLISFYELSRGEVDGWRDIISAKGKRKGELRVKVKFRSADEEKQKYYEDCMSDILANQYKIDAYFPVRAGCQVDLFSCARNSARPVGLSNGKRYQPGSCYLDMYRTIVGAQKFIYITGWSVWTSLHLVRGQDCEDLKTEEERQHWQLTLGELLSLKADQGVRVLLMIWSDLSELSGEGMMGTHGAETWQFFRDTSVECCLVARDLAVGDVTDVVNKGVATASYTHHQKSIIADSGRKVGPDGRRTVVAFVGGLDITDGRYDTPDHPLFKTLFTEHSTDFYQNSAPGVTANHGPRQPWQDIHSKLTGPVAFDVCKNFVERWTKQSGKSGCLLHLKPERFNLDAQTGNWNAQLLRSITNDSVNFSDAITRGHTLTVKKSRTIEDSITRAYIKTIRAAERFIYIENQYFLGSSYAWMDDQKVPCHHTIPAEIAEKIVDKIEAGEEFTAYVVIPLHPEGDPAANPTQEILAWQRRTMSMMYRRIAQALSESGSQAHPQDFLLFLCLVNKEGENDIPEGLDHPQPGSKASQLRESRRLMVYVHSKLMIVDDSVAIVGSANINQRSLAGSRDSELAVIVHQPEHTLLTSGGNLPGGEVASFRMRVMEEHLGVRNRSLTIPHTQECNRFVRQVCSDNWETYMTDGGPGMEGHLVEYPIFVSREGQVSEKADCAYFPDTSALVEGAKSLHLPGKLTT